MAQKNEQKKTMRRTITLERTLSTDIPFKDWRENICEEDFDEQMAIKVWEKMCDMVDAMPKKTYTLDDDHLEDDPDIQDALTDLCNDVKESIPQWEDVYYKGSFDGHIPKTGKASEDLKPLKGGIYFQTFGGGPEGGYVYVEVEEDTHILGRIYKVERTWGTPFTIKERFPLTTTHELKEADETNCYERIRIIRI